MSSMTETPTFVATNPTTKAHTSLWCEDAPCKRKSCADGEFDSLTNTHIQVEGAATFGGIPCRKLLWSETSELQHSVEKVNILP